MAPCELIGRNDTCRNASESKKVRSVGGQTNEMIDAFLLYRDSVIDAPCSTKKNSTRATIELNQFAVCML